MFQSPFIIPVVALMIPITAIVMKGFHDIIELFLRHSQTAPNQDVASLKKRMDDMEYRILTLQDLVIGGDLDIQRKFKQAEIAEAAKKASAQNADAQRQMSATDSNMQPPMSATNG